jgi:hypothetical protein
MTLYDLVARTRIARFRGGKMTVAESLRGEESVELLRAEIAAVARPGHSR